MAKTEKFNHMIEAFECDFVLARDVNHSLRELDGRIVAGDVKVLKDIELLEELSYLLRHGKAEIHMVDE